MAAAAVLPAGPGLKGVANVVDVLLRMAIFASGVAGVLLLLNATEKLGMTCIGACFVLRFAQLRFAAMYPVSVDKV